MTYLHFTWNGVDPVHVNMWRKHHQSGSWVDKVTGDKVQFPFFFILVVTGSNSLAAVIREPDATKNGLYQLVLWWGCGDELAFPSSSYGSNWKFNSGWKPRWSRLRRKNYTDYFFMPFYLEKKKKHAT